MKDQKHTKASAERLISSAKGVADKAPFLAMLEKGEGPEEVVRKFRAAGGRESYQTKIPGKLSTL